MRRRHRRRPDRADHVELGPPTHALTLAQKEWCDLVEKNANGKIRCNHLPRAVAAPPAPSTP
ncbi:hypothetical protein [Ramlibacter montanisoli]|uniref:hypothetical protein n=1 Tax=Ramlibacter montanisoli TaxID=2732512 RepID=UPI00209C21E5|nr:hypothetical protein [Ramlibacter montanisoli]